LVLVRTIHVFIKLIPAILALRRTAFFGSRRKEKTLMKKDLEETRKDF